jgi:hypothetical protein
MSSEAKKQSNAEFGPMTRVLAGFCHRCGICTWAAKRPDTSVEKVMSWHRTWCPAWKAHTQVYGEKQLG